MSTGSPAADRVPATHRKDSLERKDHLKVEAPIRGRQSPAPPTAAAEKPANRVRLVKQGRAEVSDSRPEVHVIKDISNVDAGGEVEALAAGGSAAAEQTASTTSA